MDVTIQPRQLAGAIRAIPSKSVAHRALICAAFADVPTCMECPLQSSDIEATADCLRALGAGISCTGGSYQITPIREIPEQAELFCRDSGSTLRFLLPIAGALGVDTVFHLTGRLAKRPLSPLWEELERMGCSLSRPTADTIRCTGQLRAGIYRIRGDVSSQFVTGLLLALSLLREESTLELTGKIESAPYIHLTLSVLERFGISPEACGTCYRMVPSIFRSPGLFHVEGDWSNGAFWLTAQALGSGLTVTGLEQNSVQGDRAVVRCLADAKHFQEIDVSDIPDLVPILAVAAGANAGARFKNAGRLRLKESDRLESVAAMIRALGGSAEISEDTLTVSGTGFTGGTVDAAGDHRIAMAAAIAATVCTSPVTVCGAEAVQKSYPAFWEDYKRLGGKL